jgi:GDPmannose 4,6-dehydratase
LQQEQPEDFVIATGEQHSVREFCERAFRMVGMELEWRGEGLSETGVVVGLCDSELFEPYSAHCAPGSTAVGKPVVFVDPAYFRPTEVETLLGDPGKSRDKLGWRPEVTFNELISEMVVQDLDEAARVAVCKTHGFETAASCEANL